MEDQLITFETAKLAKEKGFNVHSSYGLGVSIYTKDGKPEHTCYTDGLDVLKPTQSLLQRWLREIYNIDIDVLRSVSKHKLYYYRVEKRTITSNNIDFKMDSLKLKNYKTSHLPSYEQALESALVISLNLINNG